MPNSVPTTDPVSLRELVHDHGARILGLCLRLDPDPDDAYQAIWEKIWVRLSELDTTRGSTRAWLVTIAHHVLVDRYRRRRARGEPVPLPDVAGGDPGPVETLVRTRRLRSLERAIGRLPESGRRVVVLHHIEGLALEEIARLEALPVGTVKSRLHRSRARLAMWLSDERSEEP